MAVSRKKSTRKRAEEEGKNPPHVSAINVGSMGETADSPVEELRAANPDKEYRYVYAPEHKSDYSQLVKRRTQGYTPVEVEDAEIEQIHGLVDGQVRVGDVVLCEIDKEKKEEREEMLAERAKEDARRSQQVFEQHIRNTKRRGVGAAPVGSVQRSSREYSVEAEE